ncbi:6859_t:CDS:2 [Acaulospora morrowiae]|uniref:Vacuolar calcium ion transporter n=1 Tax=Acaulospora morrowiae TaxID=94023 RepID=A0A9N8WHL5_9GLOM|nr:6859_t:CDS:2 [Acaulospora morrowiae]
MSGREKGQLEIIYKDDAETTGEKKPQDTCCSWIINLLIKIRDIGGVSLLLVFVLLTIIMAQYKINQWVMFLVSFIAIIPLSNILTIGLNDLTARLGPAYLSILHAFSGNFVELVIEVYALLDGRYAIVRSAILGAILCNITLVLGMAFLAGSWPTQGRVRSRTLHLQDSSFQAKLFVNTSASILALGVLGLVIPAAFKIAAIPQTSLTLDSIECDLQTISHATAIILLLVYCGLLVFQLKTHVQEVIDAKEYEFTDPKYNLFLDIFLVAASIAGIIICARYLVTTIEHLAEEFELGTGFVGVVLFPLCVVSNFIEHYQAIKDAFRDKVDTAVGLILNTSVQMTLLVTPILVIIGWIIGKPLTLDFNVLEIAVLACAVLIVNYLVADNQATWLEGYMLVISYVLIAVAFFYFPNTIESNNNVYCNPFSRNMRSKNASTTVAA